MKKAAVFAASIAMTLLLATTASARSILSDIITVKVVNENGIKEVARQEVLERVAREAKALEDELNLTAPYANAQTSQVVPMISRSDSSAGGSLLARVRGISIK